MGNLKKSILFPAAILAISGLIFSANSLINFQPDEKVTIADQVKQNDTVAKEDTETENVLSKTDAQGAVAVKATLLPGKSNQKQLMFEIVMNTHSVSLSEYDIPKIARLALGGKEAGGNFVWEPSGEDSHHMSGFLTWNGQLEKGYNEIALKLENIDNIPERVFNWKESEIKRSN